MLKVANVIEEGRLGGPQNRILLIANELRNRIETTVVVPVIDSDTFIKKLNKCSVPYKKLPITRLTRSWGMIFRYVTLFPYEILILSKYFKSEKFDLIHISGGAWQFKGVIAAKLANIKVVWHLNDTKSCHALINWIFRILYRKVDALAVAGERVENYYLTTLKEINKPIFHLPAPVSTKYFNRYSPEIKSNIQRIGMVANINPVKGIDVFIKTVNFIKNNYRNDVEFLIAGAVYPSQENFFFTVKNMLRELSLNNVHFVGPTDDVKGFLESVSIYICTSHAEASPLSVWEAMSMSLPIVSTDVGDVGKYIKHGVNGYVCSPGDHNCLAECVISLLDNDSKRKEFGERSRQIAIQNLDVGICAKNHLDMYQKLISL